MESQVTTQPKKRQPRVGKSRGGRPPLPDSERRAITTKIGWRDAEFEHLLRRADAAGMSEHDLIRHCALGMQLPSSIPVVNREALVELNRVGHNLNQVLKRINSGQAATGIGQVIREVQQAARIISGVGRHDSEAE